MERYALFFCSIRKDITLFQFITIVDIIEWNKFPAKIGNVMFYLAEASDSDKGGKTPPEHLEWTVVGTDMKLKHGKNNVYLLMDQ